jgi:hypothetical protein
MINPIRLSYRYRDFWGVYDSWAAAQIDDVLNAGCYAPRYYHAPRNSDELITGPGGYLKYSLVIQPGSWILGYWHKAITTTGTTPSFLVQITDLGLNHKWFTTPLPEFFFGMPDGPANNITPTGPSLLAGPYPVVEPGTFLVEFWQPNNSTNRCQLTFAVAEPVPPEETNTQVPLAPAGAAAA